MRVHAYVLMHRNLDGLGTDTTPCWDWHRARWTGVISNCKGRYTLSVKLNDFTVWRHTWRKKLLNCAILTGNSAGLSSVLSSRLSHTELCSSLKESHSFLRLPADTTMASSQRNPFSSNSFSSGTLHGILLFKYHFFSTFRITLWPIWLANSKWQPCFYPP
jgi:hypothetical protein